MAKCKFCGAEVQIGQRCGYCQSMAEPMYYSDDVFKHFREEDGDNEIHDAIKNIAKARTVINRSENHKEGNREYTVQEGDSLWKIARKFYRDGSRWKEIYEKNNHILIQPGYIIPGMVLIIP